MINLTPATQFAHWQRATSWSLRLLLALTLVFLAAVSARCCAATIYRCVKDGHVTLTDQACDVRAGPVAPTAGAALPVGPPVTPEGHWHGSANLLETINGKAEAVRPETGSLTLVIDTGNAVTGELREHGCHLAGRLGTAYDKADYAVTLDASGCRESSLNLGYTGTLQLGAAGQPSRLALSGITGFATGKNPVSASIRADLQKDTQNQTLH